MKHRAYPEYKPSGVEWLGEVPEHWEAMVLKRTFFIMNGSTPKSSEPAYWDGEIPWATPDDLGNLKGDTIETTRRMITQEGYESCGTSMAPTGSLVLSTRAPIGHLAIAGIPLCTNQGCRCLVFRDTDDHRFYYYQLIAAKGELESWGQGSTFKELGRDKLGAVRLIRPPSPEQRAIAAFLDRETARIDALIEKKQRQIELLQEKRSALISHAVTKGLDPNAKMKDSGIDWLGEIPVHWEVRKLKYIASVQFSNVDKNTIEGEEPVRLCNYVDVYNNDFITNDFEFMQATATRAEIGKFTVKHGDVIITKDSESWTDIAVPAYVADQLEGVLCGYHLSQIRANGRMLDGKYLFRAFASKAINYQFQVASTGITRYGLGNYWLENGLFVLPPLSEQRAIAAFLDRETGRIDMLINKIQISIDTLREFRTALISAAVTGKIDVRKEVPNAR